MASKSFSSRVEKKEEMKNITINLQEDYIKLIEDLVTQKIFESRSDVIRVALREFLPNECEFSVRMKKYLNKKGV
jgi:Arc/MetJ-type ribon-helix-helix transcriptional regulator